MRRITLSSILVASCLALPAALPLAGCDGGAEEAGEKIDGAVDDAGDALEKAGDDIEDAADDVGDKVDDGLDGSH